MLEAKQKAEAALNKMHQRMTSKAAQPDSNPFMAPPVVEQLPAAAAAAAAAVGSAALDQQNGIGNTAGDTGAGEQRPLVQHPLLQQQALRPQQQQQHQGDLDEDALFEQALVLKAFSSVLPPELLSKETKAAAADQQQQQDGVVEEQPMDIDGAAAANIPPGSQTWLGWKPQIQQQQQQGEDQSSAADLAVAAAAGADVLDPGIDPLGLAAGKRAALVLVSKHRPPDAYAEKGRGVGAGGSRQRKSKYDADPRVMQAEGILAAGPEQMFASVGGGVHASFGLEEELG